MECLGVIFFLADMVIEIRLIFQEISILHVIFRIRGVPGGIQIVEEITQPDNVPAMGAAVSGAGNVAAVQTGFQRHAVEEGCITLADSGAVDQRRVRSILQHIGSIVQIIVIISNVMTDVVIDGSDSGIFALQVIHMQLIQHLCHPGIHNGFLGCGGVILHGKGQIHVVVGLIIGVGSADTHSCIVGFQVVAFVGHTGVLQGFVHNRPEQRIECLIRAVILRGAHLIINLNIRLALDHSGANGIAHFTDRIQIRLSIHSQCSHGMGNQLQLANFMFGFRVIPLYRLQTRCRFRRVGCGGHKAQQKSHSQQTAPESSFHLTHSL